MEEKIIDGVKKRRKLNKIITYKDYAEIYINSKRYGEHIALVDIEELKARLTPLEDSYFNGLSSIEIAGLAKKSIRITSYNRQLEHALEEIKGTIKHFKTYFSEKELNKVKFSDITVIEEIITEAIGE